MFAHVVVAALLRLRNAANPLPSEREEPLK
jgi:hypothetical protein